MKRSVGAFGIWMYGGKRPFCTFRLVVLDANIVATLFLGQLPFVDSCRRQSRVLEMQIYQQCLSSTCKAVAVREALSHSTVKEILNRYAALKQNSTTTDTLRVLGIDEISLKKRHRQFVLVISDITRKCVLAVLPDREKKGLENWIETLSQQTRKSVRFVSIDMWAPYYQAARNKLPRAKIVVDRFHVMKQLNARLTQLRTKYLKQCSPEIQRILKGSRWILVRNRCELSSEQEDQLNDILKLCPEVRTLYLLKKEFHTIFEKINNREKAARFLDAWVVKAKITGDRYLAKFVAAFKNWREEILNYFIGRVTNGFVEG